MGVLVLVSGPVSAPPWGRRGPPTARPAHLEASEFPLPPRSLGGLTCDATLLFCGSGCSWPTLGFSILVGNVCLGDFFRKIFKNNTAKFRLFDAFWYPLVNCPEPWENARASLHTGLAISVYSNLS